MRVQTNTVSSEKEIEAAMLKDNEHTNSLGMKLMRIEAGSFTMGETNRPLPMDVAGRDHRMEGEYDELPTH